MKMAIGAVLTSVVSSTCCLGPIAFTALGAGGLAAAAGNFHPFQPLFLGVSAVLLGAAFYITYRPARGESRAPDGACAPSAKRTAKMLLWVATVLAVLFAAFPYYGV